MLLDRSGSMQCIKSDMEGACNHFLEKQKEVPGACTLSIHQFDDNWVSPEKEGLDYETVCDFVSIKEAPNVVIEPRGSTPLLDATAKMINDLGAKLGALSEERRPGKVIVVIITDGMENASREYAVKQIREMIELQKGTYKWEFVFLGANFEACEVGESYGIGGLSSLKYAANASGCACMAASLADNVTAYRCGTKSAVTFEDEDYVNQEKSGA
jgi:hypothetical protein